MPTLICYDIHNNTLRTKLGKKIIEAGLDRINKSVYLGPIEKPLLQKLETELSQAIQKINDPGDSLIVIPISDQHIHMLRVYGNNELDKKEITGEKSTIMIQEDEEK